MTQAVQSVVYRLDPAQDPAWQFYSMPESIVGGGRNLDDARAEYQDALRFSLETDDVPEVHEYVEREIGDLGIWLRLPLSHPNFDGVLKRIRRQIVGFPENLDWFFENPTAGGDPVVIPASLKWPLSSILSQMTPYDSLILAMLRQPPGERKQNAWLALSGFESETRSEEPLTSFVSMGLTPDSPLRDVVEAALRYQVTKIGALALC